MAKSYPQLTFDYILYKMSYVNLIMYSSVLPSYDNNKEEKKEKAINGDDPANRDAIRKTLFG